MTPTLSASVPNYAMFSMFRRFTVDEYHRMIQSGVFVDGEPFELLEGYVVQKTPHGIAHDATMDDLDVALTAVVPAGWFVRSQRAVTLTDSEPEPDYAVVREPRSRYRASHPRPADIGLLIEVSDSSRVIDRTDKARVYAQAGIPVYWVVNIPDKRIEVFSQPSGPAETPAYADRQEYPVGTAVPVVLDGTEVGTVAVAEVIRG
jgi:Uma2 family endonuclease